MEHVLSQSFSLQHQEHFVKKMKEKSSHFFLMIFAGYSMEKPYCMERQLQYMIMQ